MATQPMRAHGGVERFSTRGIDRSDRIPKWEQHNAQALVGVVCRTLDDHPLDATELTYQAGSTQFAYVEANAHVVERTAKQIAGAPVDAIVLYFTLYGESFFYDSQGVNVQRPGSLIICDAREPFMRGFAHGLRELAVRIPRPLFAEVAGSRDVLPNRTMQFTGPQRNVFAAKLAGLIRSTLLSPDSTPARDTPAVTLSLLSSLLSDTDSRNASRRVAAEAAIERLLHDPQLTAHGVAAEIGVSERQLSRTFAATGAGVAKTILQLRLKRAEALLRSPQHHELSIRQIAESAGFSTYAHFSRSFAERYSRTPSETRQQASG